jgi:hypothetical protein
MAFVVTDLDNYGREDSLPFLTKALFGAPTAALLQGAGQVIPGIKTTDGLNILESTIFFQANGCEPSTSGSTTFSDRVLTVGDIQVYEVLCPKTLKTKWMQTQMAAGSSGDNQMPFAEIIGNEKIAAIQNELETDIWQGTIALNQFDGFNTILTALGFGGAGDPIEGNPTTGGGWTQLTSLTVANIDDAVLKMINQAQASTDGKAILSRADRFIAMGVDTFLLYKQHLVAANAFHYNPETGNQFTAIDPISGTTVYGLPGLNGTNKMHFSYWANYYIGTDLAGEEESFEFIIDAPKKTTIFNAEFKYGVQVAFPTQVVYFTL